MFSRQKIVAARTQLSAMGGFFMGMIAPQFVPHWPTLQKAALAGGVTTVGIFILLSVLPKQ